MIQKVKTIREYLKEGPPKFNIINRRGNSSVLHVSILSSDFADGKIDSSKDIALQIDPPESGLGLIKDVVRILDGVTFSQGDSVDSEKGNGFLISFNEDRIHCDIAYLFEQNLVTIDIDFITKVDTVEISGEEEGE